MEQGRSAAHELFNTFIEGITLGIIPDVKTAIWAMAGTGIVLLAFDIITLIITGASPSDRVSEWWEKSGDDMDYKQYKKKRDKRQDFADRYHAEQIGKDDAEAGIAYLKKARSKRG